MRTLLIASLLLPLGLAAQEPAKPTEPATKTAAAKDAAATDLQVGTSVEKRDLVGGAQEFKIAPDTKLWAWARVSGQAGDAKLALAFWKGDKEAFKKELTATGSPWRVYAYKTFRSGDAGEWTAKLLGPDGKELASKTFKVEIQK